MGTKLFSLELPEHKATIDTWIATLIQGKLGVNEWIAPLGADGIIPSQFLPSISLSWGNITGILSDQTDLNTALGSKASTDSPAFSGVPTAPNAVLGTDSLQIATTAFVQASLGTIPLASIASTPTIITADTVLTVDDIKDAYFIINASSTIQLTLPSAIGLATKAFNFVVYNIGQGTAIFRDSSGSLLEAVLTNKIYFYSVADNTVQNGYSSIVKSEYIKSSGFVSPPIEIYKTNAFKQLAANPLYYQGRIIELTSTKWALMYSLESLSLDTYLQIMEWNGTSFDYGVAVEITDTYNTAYIWKQTADGSLLGCGLETGEGANYIRSLSISGLTITKNPVVAVQSSTGAYQSDTTHGIRLNDTQALLWYVHSSAGDPSVRVATVNGTSWTFGTEYSINASGSIQNCHMISATEFLVFYYSSAPKVRKGTISGSTITLNAEDIIDINGASGTGLCSDIPTSLISRDDGTFMLSHAGYLANFSINNGVYAEIGTLTISGGVSTYPEWMHKLTNGRVLVFCGTYNITIYIVDYTTTVPTIIDFIDLSNIGDINISQISKLEYTVGKTSFSVEYFDEIKTEIGRTEISVGSIVL